MRLTYLLWVWQKAWRSTIYTKIAANFEIEAQKLIAGTTRARYEYCCCTCWSEKLVLLKTRLKKIYKTHYHSVAVQEPARLPPSVAPCSCIPSRRCCGSKKPLKTLLSAAAQTVCTTGEGTVDRTKEHLYVYLKGHSNRFTCSSFLKKKLLCNE